MLKTQNRVLKEAHPWAAVPLFRDGGGAAPRTRVSLKSLFQGYRVLSGWTLGNRTKESRCGGHVHKGNSAEHNSGALTARLGSFPRRWGELTRLQTAHHYPVSAGDFN